MTNDEFFILSFYAEKLPEFLDELFDFISPDSFQLTEKYSNFVEGLITNQDIQAVLLKYDHILYVGNEFYLRRSFKNIPYDDTQTSIVFRLYDLLRFPKETYVQAVNHKFFV